uniref:Late embryogenesis abundant protein LEA-2 subgroup domain-containing protein n=1 Tax=Kalanchoe fedtschenkoi TaxID=63787 RepID=A0A7N0TJ01_KALFE
MVDYKLIDPMNAKVFIVMILMEDAVLPIPNYRLEHCPLGRSRFTRPPYNCYAIREEAPDEDDHNDHHNSAAGSGGYDNNTYYNHPNSSYSRPCQFTLAISGFIALFGFFCLILWAAAKPFKPNITVKSLTTHNMNLGVGVDHTGVPTRMLTLNCSVDIAVHNPATFFGIHLRSKSLQLMYSRITIATGQISKYYQARKSRGMLKVKVEGHEVALYGVGESLAKSSYLDRIPVRLVFHLFSTGKVVGKLVSVEYKSHVSCSLFITKSHSIDNNKPINLQHNACIYL